MLKTMNKKLCGINEFFIIFSIDLVKISIICSCELCIETRPPKNWSNRFIIIEFNFSIMTFGDNSYSYYILFLQKLFDFFCSLLSIYYLLRMELPYLWLFKFTKCQILVEIHVVLQKCSHFINFSLFQPG